MYKVMKGNADWRAPRQGKGHGAVSRWGRWKEGAEEVPSRWSQGRGRLSGEGTQGRVLDFLQIELRGLRAPSSVTAELRAFFY